MAPRVLLLTQWFDPEPTFKGLVFARELVRQGFEVDVLTGFPNYPGGRLYPGYRMRWRQRELIDGVRVTRVPLYPSHDNSAIQRVLNYVSFAAAALLHGLSARPCDVVYAYHPPLTVGIAASILRLVRRTPVVYDIQDMWPDTLRATGMIGNPRVLDIVGKVCAWVYRRVDHIVVLSPGFKQLLVERGVPASKIDIICNWADEASLAQPSGVLPQGFPGPERFRIVYAGNMGRAQALDVVLDAAALLKTRGAPVSFVLVGGGLDAERLSKLAIERGLDNVTFLPPVPMREVGTLLNAADALLVHLRRDPLFRITIPSKTQAYMTQGKPLLMAVDGDAADLVQAADCGVVAESEDAASLADAAERLAAMPPAERDAMGSRAQAYYRQHLSLEVGTSRFGDIFRKLARDPSA
ncbi:glycosyltransferase family 4 protein [Cupriavidus sp. H18C2]|uniref:glycosyltransferase family 4 protein n=1 Tax=Cupriavidus sp. H18C2 TaxID=3241602 RepID=UPI003BF7AFE3